MERTYEPQKGFIHECLNDLICSIKTLKSLCGHNPIGDRVIGIIINMYQDIPESDHRLKHTDRFPLYNSAFARTQSIQHKSRFFEPRPLKMPADIDHCSMASSRFLSTNLFITIF